MNEYNEGDLVEAVKVEIASSTRFRGVIRKYAIKYGNGQEFRVIAQTYQPTIEYLERNDFTITVIEKAQPKVELPTEPWSYYLDKYGAAKGGGNIWFTDGQGLMHSWPAGSNPEKYAPFVRMELPGVTAKAVLDHVRGYAWADGFATQIEATAKKFGVEL